MLKEFIEGSGDMHSLCAKMVFAEELKDIEVKDIKKVRPDLRKKVKSVEFAKQFEIFYSKYLYKSKIFYTFVKII